MSWSKDGKILFSCSIDGEVKSWDFSSKENSLKFRRSITMSREGVFGVELSPNTVYATILEK